MSDRIVGLIRRYAEARPAQPKVMFHPGGQQRMVELSGGQDELSMPRADYLSRRIEADELDSVLHFFMIDQCAESAPDETSAESKGV